MTALEHYRKAFKDAWLWMLGTALGVVFMTVMSDEPLPSDSLAVGVVVIGVCLFYNFVRRDDSLEAALIMGTILPADMLYVMEVGPLHPSWAYVLLGLCSFIMIYLHWRDFIVALRKAKEARNADPEA